MHNVFVRFLFTLLSQKHSVLLRLEGVKLPAEMGYVMLKCAQAEILMHFRTRLRAVLNPLTEVMI